jgi:hypothetical protein
MNSIDPPKPSKTWRLPALLGLLLGLCLAAAGVFFQAQDRSQTLTRRLALTAAVAHMPTATPQPTVVAATETPKPTVSPTLSPAPTQTAATSVDAAILKVETQMTGADRPAAQTALLGLLGDERDPQSVARIFADLGELETGLGHTHLACGYYEQAYALDKTPATLLKLAESDTLAAKYEQARMRYMELIDWQGSDADPYRADAQSGLDMVNMLLGAVGF